MCIPLDEARTTRQATRTHVSSFKHTDTHFACTVKKTRSRSVPGTPVIVRDADARSTVTNTYTHTPLQAKHTSPSYRLTKVHVCSFLHILQSPVFYITYIQYYNMKNVAVPPTLARSLSLSHTHTHTHTHNKEKIK